MTMWVELIAGVLMGFFGSIPVAGPVALVVVSRGLSGDTRGGLRVTIGAGVAEGVLAAIVFGGLGFAIQEAPGLERLLDWLGVGVLVLIGGWFSWKGLGAPSVQAEVTSSAPNHPGRDFALGLSMVVGNPGMIGTWGGAIAALEGTGAVQASVSAAPAFGLGVAFGVVGWFWLGLLALRRWRGSLNGRVVDASVRVIGFILLSLGVAAGFALYGASSV